MVADMFMKFDGIKGESSDKKHKGWVDILSWSWGATNEPGIRMGGGGGSGKVNVKDLSFTKYIDSASSDLILASFNGRHIPEVVFSIQRGGEDPHEYLQVTLSDVLVSSFNTGGTQAEERQTEKVTLNFGQIKFEYLGQDRSGKPSGKNKMGWDVPANQKI